MGGAGGLGDGLPGLVSIGFVYTRYGWEGLGDQIWGWVANGYIIAGLVSRVYL